ASGLDPKGLAVPEVGHLRRTGEYRAAAAAFASGTPDGLTRWLLHCCWAWQLGAREAESIAAAA
ncbi:MAG: oxidoreductase, partial [Actinomycetota bacterium]|nr:oxidoreductase [Actinomycetota bacterium]